MIIFTHHTGEPHGILGAQVAATFFHQKLSIPSIVVGIERKFSKEGLLRFIDEYYAGKWSHTGEASAPTHRFSGGTLGSNSRSHASLLPRERAIAFSHLCGRPDLIELIQAVKQRGFTTILGGPQARQDFRGEPDTDLYPHRFKGLKSIIDIAFQGPG